MAFADLIPDTALHYGTDFGYLEQALPKYPELSAAVDIELALARDTVKTDLLAEWGLDETVSSDLELFEDRVADYSDRIKRAIAAKQMALYWDGQGGDVTSLMFRKARSWERAYKDFRSRFSTIGYRPTRGRTGSISLGQ